MIRIGGFLLITLIAIMMATGVASLLYSNELSRLRATVSHGSLVAELDVGPVEYADSGAGIPLLSIHGAGGGFDQGLALAADLVGGGFRVIAPSRFGYLRTPVPQDPSAIAQADAHSALLSKLNVPKAVVVGVSAGARSAVELALRHPDKVAALILVVPALYSPTSPVSTDIGRGNKFAFWAVNAGGDFAWWAAETIAPSILIRFVGVRPALVAAAPQAEKDRIASFVKSVEPLSLRVAGLKIDSAPQSYELPLQEITAPTIIISARDDLFNTLPSAEFAASRIHGARLVVFDTGGHLLVGRVQAVRKAIRAFLAGAGLTPSG
ncbi:alpha/beta fold hydrolase [Mesorhizobium sp. J8]|uniref:alpha/beta fold hydrolase n=1 Tax=Mesorhizobium sp. J8 TaxID=2777475 RepID=UPI00191560AE|nr:alpha/beta hydrolase [Mesorhizobium sp. J8]BCM20879.1 AB hydrolase superfamily protein YvaM [Mesorhizobium sp. J8]